MPSPEFARFAALPPLEQTMMSMLVVLHGPISRTRMAPWFTKLKLRNPETTKPFIPSELRPIVEGWEAQGLVHLCPETGSLGQYAVHGGLCNDVALHVGPEVLGRIAKVVRTYEASLQRDYWTPSHEQTLRELFLSLYLERVDWLEDALERHSDVRHEPIGVLLLDAFGFNPPLAGLTRVGDACAHAYLASLFDVVTLGLQPVGPGVLAYVHQERSNLQPKLLAEVAFYTTLRGDFEAARQLLSACDGTEVHAARCFVALAEGHYDQARAHARAAVSSLDASASAGPRATAKTAKRRKTPTGTLWQWVLLALLTSTSDPEAPLVARAELQALDRRSVSNAVLAAALRALSSHVTADAVVSERLDEQYAKQAEDWPGTLLWSLVLRFIDGKLPARQRQSLAQHGQAAAAAGLDWLANELGAATASGPSKYRDVLSGMYKQEAPWERSLRALEGAITMAGGAQQATPEGTTVDERLAWTLREKKSGAPEVIARVQARTKTGHTAGRQIGWKALYDQGLQSPLLDDHDRRAVRTLIVDRTQSSAGIVTLPPEGVLALIGHPRVFADNECRTPTEVVRGHASIEIRDVAGETVVRIEPEVCLAHPVACVPEGERTLLYALTREQALIAQQLTRNGLRLPAEARTRAQEVLGHLVAHFPVSSEVALAAPHVDEVVSDSRIHVQLRKTAMGMLVRLCVEPLGHGPRFTPGTGSRNVLGTQKTSATAGTTTVRCTRDLEAEQRALVAVLAACPTLSDLSADTGELMLPELTRCLELLCELRVLGDEVITEWPEGQALRVGDQRELRHLELKVRARGSWLSAEGELSVDDTLKLDFRTLLALMHTRDGRFLKLDDGRFVALSESLQRTLESASTLSHTRGKQLELHPLALFGSSGLAHASLDCDASLRARLARANEAASLDPQVPSTFEAKLRPYQEQGYAFMSRLAHWGAGAVLADDMGLGKTLQTLALLVEHAPRGPSLVVAPTSVCTNWLDEARKFAPSLRVVRLAGSARETAIEQLGPFDLLVCSYGLLQQERERLRQQSFQVVVLDEAQAIKNAATHRAKAALALVGEVRIALTGTPIENHLGELWSIVSFTNPGLLGSEQAFEERFVKPIQKNGNRAAAQLLRRLIAPFVLRRKKSEVLDDLPDKTVITLHIEPSREERAFFAALREEALARVADRSKPAEARFRLLAELTRLRRAACHPELVSPGSGLTSSKLAALETLLTELIDGGHRVLVFSQFVDYLTLVRARLEALQIGYQYLDGSSSPASRAASVAAFQAGASEVFLISLKAGGFGLNLTAADYVIHLDPWWNPAVEDQASDRAHRIGQTRPVTIYRLLMEGSIEQKILALHANKRELADDVLDGTGTGPALGVDELIALLSEPAGEAQTRDQEPATTAHMALVT